MTSFKREAQNVVIPVSILILDIEGTTSSISFVKDVLFPYVRKHLEGYVNKAWDSVEFQEIVNALKAQAKEDQLNAKEGVIAIPDTKDKDVLIKAVIDNVNWQMDNDRKTKSLKDLQGLIMEEGYKKGNLKGHIYDDVETCLKSWTEQEKSIYIYSSGSIHAQKLLFGYSEKGDLLSYIKGHFDTSVGMKDDVSSYKQILEEISCRPSEAAFLTDIPKEAKAAKEAGILAILLSRKGNAPFTEEDEAAFPVITSFAEIEFEHNIKKRKTCTYNDVTNENKSITTCKVSVEGESKPADPNLPTHVDVEMMEVDIYDEAAVGEVTKTVTKKEENMQDQGEVQDREVKSTLDRSVLKENMGSICEMNADVTEKQIKSADEVLQSLNGKDKEGNENRNYCALERKNPEEELKKDDNELNHSKQINSDVKDVEGQNNENVNSTSKEKNVVNNFKKAENDSDYSSSKEVNCDKDVEEENNKNANSVSKEKDTVEVVKKAENIMDHSSSKSIDSDRDIQVETNTNANCVSEQKNAIQGSKKSENEMDLVRSEEFVCDKDTGRNNKDADCISKERDALKVPKKAENVIDHLNSKEIYCNNDIEGDNNTVANCVMEEKDTVEIPKKTDDKMNHSSSKEINPDVINIEESVDSKASYSDKNRKDITEENKGKSGENKEVSPGNVRLMKHVNSIELKHNAEASNQKEKEPLKDNSTKSNDTINDLIIVSSETRSERSTALGVDVAKKHNLAFTCKSSFSSNDSQNVDDDTCSNQADIVHESSCMNTDIEYKTIQSIPDGTSESVTSPETNNTMLQVNKTVIEQTGACSVTKHVDESEKMEIESIIEQNSSIKTQEFSISIKNSAQEENQDSLANTGKESKAAESSPNEVPGATYVSTVLENSDREIKTSMVIEWKGKHTETIARKVDKESQIKPQTSSSKENSMHEKSKIEDNKSEVFLNTSNQVNAASIETVCDTTETNKTEFPTSQEIECGGIKRETQIDLAKKDINVPPIEKTEINCYETSQSVKKECGIERFTEHFQSDVLLNKSTDKNLNGTSSPTHGVELSKNNITEASHLEGKKCDTPENTPMETTVKA